MSAETWVKEQKLRDDCDRYRKVMESTLNDLDYVEQFIQHGRFNMIADIKNKLRDALKDSDKKKPIEHGPYNDEGFDPEKQILEIEHFLSTSSGYLSIPVDIVKWMLREIKDRYGFK